MLPKLLFHFVHFPDFDSPTLQGVSNHSIECGEPITPVQLGTPAVQDSLDPNPSLSYTDQDVSGCTTLRLWTAVDHAGNRATLQQFIKSTSLLPIRVRHILFVFLKKHG